MGSRIISLAEAYNRKLSDAKGNESENTLEAINYIQDNAGISFDPTIAIMFINMLKIEDRTII